MNSDAADGAKFWISFKQPAILSSFSCLQVIQNKLLWCLAAAYVTAGYVHESFKPAQMYCDLIGWKMSKVQFVTNSYDGTTVQMSWTLENFYQFYIRMKNRYVMFGGNNSIFSGSCFGVRPVGTDGYGWDLSQSSFYRK